MDALWTLGGLSWRDLVRRVWNESWEDEVFGVAARLAFYHFLAIFPVLLLFLLLLLKLSGPGSEMRHALVDSFGQLLPDRASFLIDATVKDLGRTAAMGFSIWSAIVGAAWAAVNGTWALMTGLNMAYEVKEKRPWWHLAGLALVLTIALAVLCFFALGLILYGSRAADFVSPRIGIATHPGFFWRVIQWAVIVILLLIAFALLYRFAPNLPDREWQWSTPGAVVALALWISSALLLRAYFAHFHSYELIYGNLANVAMFLIWLYVTSAAILIGGELNSQIEKAVAAQQQRPAATRDRPAEREVSRSR
ncbi:MAG: YihY/virulence factor BrkB family protein [Acidobacteriaceae bacterium]|nr:YihY/virulence factor BrkB family protein [Acidobacteriaceae bacterium]